jgi:hypothetical protein
MFRQTLLLLLASSASAFVTSPFGGCRALPQKVLQSQLLSEPNGATDPVNEPAVAEIASEGIAEESAEGSEEKKAPIEAPQKDDKDRITAFIGNLPFSKLLRIATMLVRKTGRELRLLHFSAACGDDVQRAP